MILDANTEYWSVGITVEWSDRARVDANFRARGGWCASLRFFDDGFADDDTDTRRVSTQGTLTTRYYVPDGERVTGLSAALDALIEDAERLGIRFRTNHLTYVGDGEDPEKPPPEGWETRLATEAARIGWDSYDRINSRGEEPRR